MSVIYTRKSPRAHITEALREAGFRVLAGPIVRVNARAEADEVYLTGGDRSYDERAMRNQSRANEEIILELVPVEKTKEVEDKFRGALEGLERVIDITSDRWQLLRNYSGSDGAPRFMLPCVVEVEQ